jgi:hypothetical protein
LEGHDAGDTEGRVIDVASTCAIAEAAVLMLLANEKISH